eukprot:COSAG06_NODE_58428_length_277_cov_0.578652_1_plen_31_part_10
MPLLVQLRRPIGERNRRAGSVVQSALVHTQG